MPTRVAKLIISQVMAAILLMALLYALVPTPPAAVAASEWRVCNTAPGYSTTIQAAINAAQPGDVIKVAAGVYTEAKSVGGFAYNLYISKTVHLYGGYTCNNWTTQNYTTNLTVIRPSTANISVVSVQGQFGMGTALTPTIDGFTISGGGGGNHGGGMRLLDSNALVRNNVITGNLGYLLGGGVWVQRGAPRLENNRIENNRVTTDGASGGGVELEDTQATLVGNLIASNVISAAAGSGGGIAVVGGGPVTLTGNTIQGNAAAIITSTTPANDVGYGGGVYVSNAPVNLAGNTVMSNIANAVFAFGFGGAFGYGGGVYIVNTPAFTLTANNIMSNTAGYKYYLYLSGGGLEINSSLGILSGNVIADNHANGNILFGNGGGLAAYTSTLTIQGGQILNNRTAINCEGYGGGLYAFNSSIRLDATRVENNCAANTPFYGLGGGLAFVNSPYTLTNALIINNYSFGNDTAVGGLHAGANSPGLVVNNTLANNHGQGIRTASPLTLTNNIIMGHTTGVSLTAAVPVSVTYNDFYNNTTNQRGFALDITNIVINPDLDANYHLMTSSPLIDAGTHTNAPDHDVDGEPRPMIGTSGLFRVDIGADEFTGTPQIIRNLDSTPADLTIIGPGNSAPNLNNPNDWIGYSVLGADVNGDGHADLMIAAQDWAEDFNTLNATGRLFGLFNFGMRVTGTIDLLTDTASLTVVSKYLYQHVGQAFASGDLNGDGRRDLIVGANNDDNTGLSWPSVFVLFGGPSLSGTRTLTDPTPANFMLRAPAADYDTYADKNALTSGDLNGDGVDDLIVGDAKANDGALSGAGAIFAVFGRSTLSGTHNLSTTVADFTLYGPAANAGLSKLAVGRLNNDTQVDLVARTAVTAYVMLGPISSGSRHLSSTPADITITGLQAGALSVMDLNGDGQADLILGSGNKVYVVPGPLTGGQTFNVASRAVLTITGVNANILVAGDVVGDRRPDLLIGSAFSAPPRVFVVQGGLNVSGTLPIDDLAAMLVKSNNIRNLGFDVAAGDLDGDGKSDLIMGSLFNDVANHPTFYMDAGKVFVVYGSGAIGGVNVPPTGVSVSGPTVGLVNNSYIFTATVSPLTATTPITYVWQATGQTPMTHTNGVSDTITFAWSAPGTQVITVTATNAAGAVLGIYTVMINVPPISVSISGPTAGTVNTSYVFTATVNPPTATQPITYLWQATGQSPMTHTNGVSDTAAFTWSTAGTQTITVTATNAAGMVSNTQTIAIAELPKLYMPILFK